MLCLPTGRLSFALEEHARDAWQNVTAISAVAVSLAILLSIALALVPEALEHPQWIFIFSMVSITLAGFLYAVLKSIREITGPDSIRDGAIYRLRKSRNTPYDEILLGDPPEGGEYRIQSVLDIPPTVFLLLGLRSRLEVGRSRWRLLFYSICVISGALSVGLLFFYSLENTVIKMVAQGSVFVFFGTILFIVAHSIFRRSASLAQRTVMAAVAFLMVLELLVVFGAIGNSNAFTTTRPTFRGKL